MRGFIICNSCDWSRAAVRLGVEVGFERGWPSGRTAIRGPTQLWGLPWQQQPHCPSDCYLAKTLRAAVASLGATRSSVTSAAGSEIWLPMLCYTKVRPLDHRLCCAAIDCACACEGKGCCPHTPNTKTSGEEKRQVCSPRGGESSAKTM